MKYLLLVLLSFNCLAQEVINECGQTRLEWTYDNVRCFQVHGSQVVESYFIGDSPNLAYDIFTIEQLEEEWELVE
jgi:hypothetical protein